MTKARSKGARRRHRKAPPGCELPETPHREPNGRKSRPEDQRGLTLATRCRHAGLDDTADNRRAVSAPEYGCAVGRAIMAGDRAERADLWQAVCHMRRVWVAYDIAIGAPSRHAKCLAILTPTEALTADAASPPPDLRTPEERHRQAVSAYMALRGWIGHVDNAAESAVIRAVVDEPDEVLRNWPAIRLALLCVVDGIKGRRVQVRTNATS